jgi:hypothetical protein
MFLTLCCITPIPISCGSRVKAKPSLKTSSANFQSKPQIVDSKTKPIVNVYLENSGSMDGYVTGITDFEQAVYNYLTDIKISDFPQSLNLFYINSQVIPQGSNIEDFIQKLEPTTFQSKGGDRGKTDISNVLKSILDDIKENQVAILVTDGIFSPGKGKDASQYLVNQQIGIKSSVAGYLKRYPNAAILVFQLSSLFDGYYYNRDDSSIKIKSQRPFYIWLIGPTPDLDKLIKAVPRSKFKGSGVQNVFSITSGNKPVKYAIKLGSGSFELDKQSPKTTIINLELDSKGKQSAARFSVNVNLSEFLLEDNYLQDISNYEVNNKDFTINVTKAVSNTFGYTHTINLSCSRVHKGIISIKIKTTIPHWIEDVNDSDGGKPIIGKTYGIKYQIQGVYEAFTRDTDYYTEIKINVK